MTILATLQVEDTREMHDNPGHIYTYTHMSHPLHHTVKREIQRGKRVHALSVTVVMVVSMNSSRGRLAVQVVQLALCIWSGFCVCIVA